MRFNARIDVFWGEKSRYNGFLQFFKHGGQIEFDGAEIAFCPDCVQIKKSEYVLNLSKNKYNDFCITLPQGVLKGQVFCYCLDVCVQNDVKVTIKAQYNLIFDGLVDPHKILIRAERVYL